MRYTRKILETTWYFQFILLPVIILLSVVNVDRELSTKSVFHPSNVPAAARNYIETILLSWISHQIKGSEDVVFVVQTCTVNTGTVMAALIKEEVKCEMWCHCCKASIQVAVVSKHCQ